MHWLQRFFAPQNRPFIIYVLLLLALLAGAQCYKGRFKQRTLAQMASSVRRTFTDKETIARMKMERSTLEFQVPNLRHQYPLLTNAALTRDWSTAAVLSQLDPEVCAAWRAYLEQVSPVAQAKEPGLATFLALQQGYVAEVEPLARDPFRQSKAAVLMNLRTNKFAALLSGPTYLADAARFEKLAEALADEKTLALRKAYQVALTAAATNASPAVGEYARARLELALKADQLKARAREIAEQLGELEALPSTPAPGNRLSALVRSPQDLLRSDAFATYVPQEKDFLAIELATILLGLLVTQPVEMRDRRWMKIGVSVVLVYLGLLALRIPVSLDLTNRGTNVFAFFGFLVPAALLAAVWAPSFTCFLSRMFVQLIDSSGPEETEDTRLQPAYDAARQGRFRLALKLLKPKLLLDPWHYEALILKAKLHRQLNRKWRTRWTLAKVLRNRQLTAGQRENATHLLGNLNDKAAACWSLVKREAPRQELADLFDF